MLATVNPASLNVSWQPPLDRDHNGLITGYVIRYTRVGSLSVITTIEIVTNKITYTISGLDAYDDYSVMVAALNINGSGPFSDPVVERSGDNGKWLANKLASYVVIVASYLIVCLEYEEYVDRYFAIKMYLIIICLWVISCQHILASYWLACCYCVGIIVNSAAQSTIFEFLYQLHP